MFSGVGLRATLERKFDEAGVAISDRGNVIDRMAGHLLASRSDNTVAKYSHQVKLFKDFCAESTSLVSQCTQSTSLCIYRLL